MENTDERYYIKEIHGGKYCYLNAANNLLVANDISEADTFSAKEVEHHLKGKKKNFYEAISVNPHLKESLVDVVVSEDVPGSIVAANEANILKTSWNGIVSQLAYLSNHADEYQAELELHLKCVQEEICDIQHFLELKAETVEETQSAAEMLQGCLHRRREIKDAMIVLEVLMTNLLDSCMNDRISSCQEKINALDYRHYKPRQLPQLFSDNSCAS